MILRHLLRRFFFIVVSFLPIFLVATAEMAGLASGFGCSAGASAPPVSLPAPVTGRLTVTSPDDSGVALVVGDDGSVPADALVHVANATLDTSAARLTRTLLDGLAPSAEAAGFPGICSRTFHACTFADANGSFEISVPAQDDHDLVIEILDASSGFRISAKLHRPVPKNVHFVARSVLDLGLLSNTDTGDRDLYTLMPHTVDDPLGLVSIANLITGEITRVSFDGTLPARMVTDRNSRTGVVLDPEGGFAARVDLTTNNFDAPTKLGIDAPRDVVITTDGATAVVATAETLDGGAAANARFLRSIALAGFTETSPIRISDLQLSLPGAANVDTRALDISHHIPTSGPPAFDIGAFVGLYDVGGTQTPAIGLFNASTLTFLRAIALPDGTVPEDVSIIEDAGDNGRLMVSDSANDRLLLLDFTSNITGTTITPAGQVADPNGFLLKPRRIALNADKTFAFVTAKNGNDTRPDTELTVDLSLNQIVKINPVGLGPSGLVFDPVDQNLYVGTLKSHSITILGLSDLIP